MESKRIWTFDHEPSSLDEMILSDDNKQKLQKVIKEIPNLFVYGNQGIGKGTFVNIFLKETGYDYIKMNASDENSVDDVRTKIKSFATSLGSTDLKIVYLNECDRLSANAQEAMLDLCERVQKSTRFIFVGNYPKLIPELQSRCQVIYLNNPPAKEIFSHVSNILKKEKIEVQNKAAIISVIKALYPDIRHIINTIQLNCVDGKLGEISYSSNEEFYKNLLLLIKNKKLEEIRKELKNNTIDYIELYSFLFDSVGEFTSPADMIIMIGEALRDHSIVAIKEINFITMITKSIKNGYI